MDAWQIILIVAAVVVVVAVIIAVVVAKSKSKAKQPQIIEFGQNLCNAKVDDNSVLFVRVKGIVTDKNALVVVPLTHNAIIIKGGGDYRYYRSGNYPVFDNKEEIKNWQKGLPVEVVYIPKETRVQIKWGTPNRFKYRDELSNTVVSVGARGEFDVSVSNPEQFFRKVVGVKSEFNLTEFSKRFSETVASEFADVFLKAVAEKHLSYDQFDANKKAIGEGMGAILSPKFESEWGLCVLNFLIAEFSLDARDIDNVEAAVAEKKRKGEIKEERAEDERLDDKKWERDKYFREKDQEDKAAYYDAMKEVGKDGAELLGEAECPYCKLKYKRPSVFCPHCGKRISKEPIVCSNCGKVNDSDAEFCAGCGKKLR